MSKLPFPLQERFRRLADRLVREDRDPSFEDLVKFISEESRILNHPIYGKRPMASAQDTGKKAGTTVLRRP